jgi:hypothetical protein
MAIQSLGNTKIINSFEKERLKNQILFNFDALIKKNAWSELNEISEYLSEKIREHDAIEFAKMNFSLDKNMSAIAECFAEIKRINS